LHRLDPGAVVYAQQTPEAIDAGAFHNDVVSVGNRNVLFYHEKAFLNSDTVLAELKEKVQKVCGVELVALRVPAAKVSLLDAVKSYLFNSQLLLRADGQMLLIAPRECEENPSVSAYLKELIDSAQTPIREVRFFDVKQSMRNGGGPACLRLRVVLSSEQISKCVSGVFMTDEKYKVLCDWVGRHYRDRMSGDDLRDPKLVDESRAALDELTRILGVGSIYPFQRNA
jgi:succinylarginine dihydrolase